LKIFYIFISKNENIFLFGGKAQKKSTQAFACMLKTCRY